MIRTPLTRWFDLTTPVIGAPMAGISGGALARAVSQAGGLGMIGVSGRHSAEFVTAESAVAGEDQLPFGVGLMIWTLTDRPELFEATVAARPSLVSMSFGDPAPWVGPLHDAGIAVAAQVNTVADAHRALEASVDVLVAQGTEAGGHTGQRALLPLLQEVLALTDRPVVAAGGIAWPERWPGRALVNDFSRTWHGREAEPVDDDAARQLVVEGRRTGDPARAPLRGGGGGPGDGGALSRRRRPRAHRRRRGRAALRPMPALVSVALFSTSRAPC